MNEFTCKCGWTPRENVKSKSASLFTHKNLHCKLNKGKDEVKDNNDCDCKDGGSWRLLRGSNQVESIAIVRGYKKICTECMEVL